MGAFIICRIQDFEADFLWKVSLKILNSGIILKTFTDVHANNKSADQPAHLLGLISTFVIHSQSSRLWLTCRVQIYQKPNSQENILRFVTYNFPILAIPLAEQVGSSLTMS